MSIFYQGKTWTTRDGRTMRLEEMAPGHRANLLKYLRRNIEHVRWKLTLYWALQEAFHDGGDMAHNAIEREGRFVEEASDDDLLDSLPLVRRLRWLNRKVYLYRSVSGEHFEGTIHHDCRLHGPDCYGCVYEREWEEPWAGGNPVNPVLLAFRNDVADVFVPEEFEVGKIARSWVDGDAIDLFIDMYPTHQIDHARKVLTRLARLAEEADTYDQD